MKNNQLDNFESLIKSSLDKQRAVYDSSDWDKLNKKLDQANKPFYSSPWFIAASVAAVIGTVYLVSMFNAATEQNTIAIPAQGNELTKDEQIFVNRINGGTRQLKNYGHKWAHFQTQFFQSNSQPFYVLLDSEGKTLLNKPIGYTPDVEEYASFLECGLEAFITQNKKASIFELN